MATPDPNSSSFFNAAAWGDSSRPDPWNAWNDATDFYASGVDPVAAMTQQSAGGWQQTLQQAAGERGLAYDPSDLQDVIRNVSYQANLGVDPSVFLNNAIAKYDERANNTPGRSHEGSNDRAGSGLPGLQFNDPYTNVYEEAIRKRLETLNNGNDALTNLMGFINQRFQDLSQSPGYTTEELATMRTQALEPIEAQRAADQQRVLERASRGGMLPTSGLIQGLGSDVDLAYSKLRTQADRDLAIQNINRAQQQLGEALQLGQLAVQIPDQRQQAAIDTSRLLYNIPREAMSDALGVINSANPNAAIASLLSAIGTGTQTQAYGDAANSALWGNLGTLLAGLFD